jgi:LysR family transcriptional regulator, transcriptional activator of the cysJI operon
VIADGTDFHGDVVNVAARLQAECPPGGICVSRAVRDHVHGRLDLRFEELGNLDLKNIARPVEAFVLRSDAATDRRPPVSEPPGLRSDLDLQRLHLFHRVAKLGSVARAAEELRVGQATVSAQVGELEQQWGVELLHRLPHSVALTDAGQLAFEHAERIFSQAGELRSMLQNLLGAPTGRLAVGGSLTAGEFFLPTVATRFKAHHPDVELSVALYNSSVVLDKVVRSELDLGFVGTDAIVGDLTAIPCWEDEIVIIRSTASTTGVAPDGDVLHSRQFVMREPGSGTRQHIEQSLLRRGLSVKTAMVVGSPEAVKRYVAAGVGWGFASKESIATEVATGQLAIVPTAGWDCRRVFYAVHRKGYRLSPPQQQFIEHAQILMGRS